MEMATNELCGIISIYQSNTFFLFLNDKYHGFEWFSRDNKTICLIDLYQKKKRKSTYKNTGVLAGCINRYVLSRKVRNHTSLVSLVLMFRGSKKRKKGKINHLKI